MASENVTWLLPYMVLQFAFVYAVIVGWAGLYGFGKFRSGSSLLRDILIAALIVTAGIYGLTTEHSLLGLVVLGAACGLSLILHSSEFSKTNDMAPFGYVTAISIITSLFVVSGILTSDL